MSETIAQLIRRGNPAGNALMQQLQHPALPAHIEAKQGKKRVTDCLKSIVEDLEDRLGERDLTGLTPQELIARGSKSRNALLRTHLDSFNKGKEKAVLKVTGEPEVTDGGSDYEIDDVLTPIGGTGAAAEFMVSRLTDGGTIAAVKVTKPGAYTAVPDSPVSVKGGAGSGATFTPQWGEKATSEREQEELEREHTPSKKEKKAKARAEIVARIAALEAQLAV